MDVKRTDVGGGYDRGYASCPMFWPDRAGSLLVDLERKGQLRGGRALDMGCGEGTNAAWLARRGYIVDGVEISRLALEHARSRNDHEQIRWTLEDAVEFEPGDAEYDLVVAYGLLHCISDDRVDFMLGRLRAWTAAEGLMVLVAFNDRSQDLARAHPGFEPTLRSHSSYVAALDGWDLLSATDTDLHESHPDTNIPHHHSMTRIVARRSGA